MIVIITPTAHFQIDHQFAFGVARHGRVTAERTFTRVEQFLQTTLTLNPRIGTYIPERDLFEYPINKTPFVVVYRLEPEIVRVLAFFHHAEQRGWFTPDDE